jgi:tRNA(fMet)-specific endonuclease VapC
MIGSKCLLDTSVIIHTFKSRNDIAGKLDTIQDIFVPVTVIGELYYGAYKSQDANKHILRMQAFLQTCQTIPTDATTADIYGRIKSELIKKGKPIPENDIWIAAIALQYNLPLFTTDNHFQEIEGVVIL